jgi:hypothetical protein
MMPENAVDSIAFYIVMIVFSVVIGNLIYESIVAGLLFEEKGDEER